MALSERRARDFTHPRNRLVHFCADFLDALRRNARQLDATADRFDRRLDGQFGLTGFRVHGRYLSGDFNGRLSCIFRQLAHFAGNDGEAASLFAGARRLDRRVEGEKVGLIGNAPDHVDDAADLLGTGVKARHDARKLFHVTDRNLGVRGDGVHLAGTLL